MSCAYLLSDIHYWIYTENYSITTSMALYCIHYYFCYISHACVFTMLYSFVLLLTRRVQSANAQIMVTISNPRKVVVLMEVCRQLRLIARSVNKVFQAPILGRIVVICVNMTYGLFGVIAYSDNVYMKFTTLVWCFGHTFEVVSVIYCFQALHKEVCYLEFPVSNVQKSKS